MDHWLNRRSGQRPGARRAAVRRVLPCRLGPGGRRRVCVVPAARDALQKYFPGEKPDFVSLEGYIVGTLFVEGLRHAGANLTTDRVIEALEGIHDLDLGIGTKLSFGPSEHQASHKVWGTILNEAAQYQVLDLE